MVTSLNAKSRVPSLIAGLGPPNKDSWAVWVASISPTQGPECVYWLWQAGNKAKKAVRPSRSQCEGKRAKSPAKKQNKPHFFAFRSHVWTLHRQWLFNICVECWPSWICLVNSPSRNGHTQAEASCDPDDLLWLHVEKCRRRHPEWEQNSWFSNQIEPLMPLYFCMRKISQVFFLDTKSHPCIPWISNKSQINIV